jgi:DNA-binding NarL/FixJ family response regulator
MFTMHRDGQLLKAARAAGIKDVVSKSEGIADHLFSSLRNACNHSSEVKSKLKKTESMHSPSFRLVGLLGFEPRTNRL